MKTIPLLTLLICAATAGQLRAEGQEDRAYLLRLAEQIRTAHNTDISRDLIAAQIKNKLKSQEEVTRAKRAETLAQAIRLSGSMNASPKTTQELQLALQELNKKEEYVVEKKPDAEKLGNELAERAPQKQEKAPTPPWISMPLANEPLQQTDLASSRSTPEPMTASPDAIAGLTPSSEEMRDAVKDAVSSPEKTENKASSIWISTFSANGRKK